MPLKEHLLEFRRRLMISAGAIVVGAIVGWIYRNEIYDKLAAPFHTYERQNPGALISLNFDNATAAFSVMINLAIFSGIILASPIWLYQIWAFIAPGLTKREKVASLGVVGAVIPLFLAGVAMAYITLPKALIILYGFTPPEGSNIQQGSAYFTFVTRFMFAFGAAWLLPVFLVGLNAIGVLSSQTLLKGWRPAVLMIFIAAAIITPTPDPFTMFLMAGPLVVLYFAAVGVAKLNDKRRKDNEPDWLKTPEDQASPL